MIRAIPPSGPRGMAVCVFVRPETPNTLSRRVSVVARAVLPTFTWSLDAACIADLSSGAAGIPRGSHGAPHPPAPTGQPRYSPDPVCVAYQAQSTCALN